MIELKEDEGWMLILTLVRYSLGRTSYIVGWCNEIVLRNWDELTYPQQDQIQREIYDYTVHNDFTKIDRHSWSEILSLKKKEDT